MRTLLVLVVLGLLLTSAGAATKFKRPQTGPNCRDATTGQYVTPAYAKKHPTTTVCEERK